MTAARTIDYWDIVTRSAKIAWRHKFLWFFGFFAASAGGGGNYLNMGEYGTDEIRDFFTSNVEVLALIVVFAVLVWLALLVVGVISKGALICCIDRAGSGSDVTFGEGWRAGLQAFWGMLGIAAIGLAAFLAVTAVCALAVVLPLVAGTPGVAIAVLIAAVLVVPWLAFLFLLTFVVIYAERAYATGTAGFGEAFRSAWELTKARFWQSMLMWLVSLGSGIAFFVALVTVLLVLAVPFVLIGLANPLAGLVLGIPVGFVVVILTSSAFSTYDHALWTLFYRELTALSGGRPGEAPQGGDPEQG